MEGIQAVQARIAEIQSFGIPTRDVVTSPSAAATHSTSFENALAAASVAAGGTRSRDSVPIAANVGSVPSVTPSVTPSAVGGDSFPNVPAPSPKVAAVIAFARAQLGKPYTYAAEGPNTYDCSGLTMMAWRQAGVSMDHYSGSQFQQFPRVPLDDLQPGDLVFKGPGGSSHVALYVGDGMQIAATHTGDYVRLQPLSRNLTGAVRPG